MPTVTVPSGATSSVSLSFATNATQSLATSLLSSVYAAAAAGSLVSAPQATVAGAVNEYVVTVAGAYTVPAGYNVIVDAVTSGAATITGNGASGELFVAGSGNFEYLPAGGAGTVVAGAGSGTIESTGSSTIDGFLLLGDANYTSIGPSALMPLYMEPPPLSETITTAGTYSFDAGITLSVTNEANGPTTIMLDYWGSGTVNALVSGGIYEDLGGGIDGHPGGTLLFLNAGASTVTATEGSGAATIFGGNYSMSISQGSDTSSMIFVNGSANSSIAAGAAGGILAFDSAGGTINLSDSGSSAFNYLVGGTGAETLNAALTSNTAVLIAGQANAFALLGTASVDAFFAGSGASTIVGGIESGSALPDLYAFVNGASGGSDLIVNWGSASGLVFLGYGAAGDAAIKAAIAAAPTNANTVSITLPDSTSITVMGLNGAAVNLGNNPVYLS
jgi:hypothetical protein